VEPVGALFQRYGATNVNLKAILAALPDLRLCLTSDEDLLRAIPGFEEDRGTLDIRRAVEFVNAAMRFAQPGNRVRWEIETALDELKAHLRGSKIVLRSRTPDLVRQEFYGLMMAHFAIRGLMHEAALRADDDPDQLSFIHAVRVIRRKLPRFPSIPPSAEARVS